MVLKNYRTLSATQDWDGTAQTIITQLPRDFLAQRYYIDMDSDDVRAAGSVTAVVDGGLKMITNIKGAFLDESVIAVMSASLIAPFFVPRINNVLDSVPILRDHKSLASMIAGLIVFGIAGSVKGIPLLKGVIIGVAGAFLLTAILPLYTSVTNRGVGQ